MIKNKKQHTQSKEQLIRLRALAEKYKYSEEFIDKIQYGSLECQIEDLENEISEYEEIKESGISGLSFNLSNLEKTIMSLRIASGLTQQELADKIGVAEQQIQRYEVQDYMKTNFERIIEIIGVLSDEVNISFTKNTEGKIIKFSSINSTTNEILKSIQERQSLLAI